MKYKKKIEHKEVFQSGNVTIIAISHFLHDIYTSFLAPALPLIIEKLQISYGLSGILAVIQRIPSLFNPAVGILADKMKMRYLVIASPLVTGTAMSLIGIAPGYIFLAILLLISGISSTFFHVPTPVMIKKVAGNRLGKGMSYYMVGGELARTAGPIIIFGVISLWGLEGTYKMIPLGFIASGLMYYRLRNIEISSRMSHSKWRISYRKVFLKYMPVFSITAGITFFLGAMKASLTLYLPTFLKSQGETLFFSDVSLSVLQLAGAAGTFVSGTISDKFGRTRTLLAITLLAPFLMFLFLNAEGIWKMITPGFIGFFLFAPNSVLLALIHDQRTSNMAFLNGTYMLINFFISASMVTIVGFLADQIGFDKTFRLAAFFSFGAIIIVLLARKRLK